ncbi:MAG: sel1 repeat family protein [Syntrophaceae bacterium]|nr:sel1 repeat family protein [Syntrophaceae bacterium]
MKSFFVCVFLTLFLASLSLAAQNEINNECQTTNAGHVPFKRLLAMNDANTASSSKHVPFTNFGKDEPASSDAKEHYSLGVCYLQGRGKAMNYIEAARCFTVAARQGMPEAQYQLGMLYEKGKGVPQDYKRAAEWYKKAVRQDHVLAQNALGFLYYNGKGVARDLVISLALFNIAAAAGDEDAFQNTYIAASTMSFKNFDKAKALARDRKRLYKLIGS